MKKNFLGIIFGVFLVVISLLSVGTGFIYSPRAMSNHINSSYTSLPGISVASW